MTNPYDQYKLSQRWFSDDYLRMLHGLLPKGIIWAGRQWLLGNVVQDVVSHSDVWQDVVSSSDVVQDTTDAGGGLGDMLMRLLSCFAAELARLEAAAWNLLNQTDPGVATGNMITDWERVLGLPGECFGTEDLSTEERQVNAHVKLFKAGETTTMQWYEDVAAALGFTTFVMEESPVETDPRIFGLDTTVFGPDGPRFGGRGGYSILNITSISSDGNEKVLKCIFYKFKQAHTVITKLGAEWNP